MFNFIKKPLKSLGVSFGVTPPPQLQLQHIDELHDEPAQMTFSEKMKLEYRKFKKTLDLFGNYRNSNSML